MKHQPHYPTDFATLDDVIYSPCPKCGARLKLRKAMLLPAAWYRKGKR